MKGLCVMGAILAGAACSPPQQESQNERGPHSDIRLAAIEGTYWKSVFPQPGFALTIRRNGTYSSYFQTDVPGAPPRDQEEGRVELEGDQVILVPPRGGLSSRFMPVRIGMRSYLIHPGEIERFCAGLRKRVHDFESGSWHYVKKDAGAGDVREPLPPQEMPELCKGKH